MHDVGDGAPQPLVQGEVVEADLASRRQSAPSKQVDERCLARTRWAWRLVIEGMSGPRHCQVRNSSSHFCSLGRFKPRLHNRKKRGMHNVPMIASTCPGVTVPVQLCSTVSPCDGKRSIEKDNEGDERELDEREERTKERERRKREGENEEKRGRRERRKRKEKVRQ